MDLLLLGGTGFLGPRLAEVALDRGHRLTLFHRRPTDALPQAEHILGDRGDGLDLLAERRWDAVVDIWANDPALVGAAARTLAQRTRRYAFISSISVFADESRPGNNEASAVRGAPAPAVSDGENYGARKAESERLVMDATDGGALVVRPGLIAGPGDPTDRFTYWPVRMARGGTVLAPGDGSNPAQLVDVRDLAEWVVRMLEDQGAGTYCATGPAEPMTLGDMLRRVGDAVGSDAELHWVPQGFLLEHNVQPWIELPVWIPAGTESSGMLGTDCGKAIAAGIAFRPIEATARDTLAWHRTRPDGERPWLSEERERELLAEARGRDAVALKAP